MGRWDPFLDTGFVLLNKMVLTDAHVAGGLVILSGAIGIESVNRHVVGEHEEKKKGDPLLHWVFLP